MFSGSKRLTERLRLAAIDASNLDKEDVYKVRPDREGGRPHLWRGYKVLQEIFGVYSQVVFGAEMKMVDARSSKIIWQADHTETTHGGSVPASPFSVPEAVIESSINVREKVVSETADRLVKKIYCQYFHPKILIHLSTLIQSLSDPMGPQWKYAIECRMVDTLSGISEKFL